MSYLFGRRVGDPDLSPESLPVAGVANILFVGERERSASFETLGRVHHVPNLTRAADILKTHQIALVVVDHCHQELTTFKEQIFPIPVVETSDSHHPEALFLESILEHLPHMIFVKEAKNLSFVRFNAAGERLVGLPRSELVGRNDFDFFPEEEASFFQSKDREVLAKKELHDIPEETIQTRHGPRLLHTKKIPILDADGEPLYLLGISEDITEKKRAQAALAARLEAARENERRLVAQELHDELGQLLTGLQLDLAWLQPRLPEELTDHTASMEQLLERTLATVRRLAKKLRPQIVDDLGLVAGLEGLATEMCERKKIDCKLVNQLGDSQLTDDAVTALFRIGQEALNNVVRHSEASRVQITLRRLDGHISLCIEDNGKGFRLEELPPDTLGILGMRERISTVGGQLKLNSSPGKGTSVEAIGPADRCLKGSRS